MTGTLFLIPNTLGETEALANVLPEQVQRITSQLDYFVAENAKTARAFLKLVGAQHPLCKPMQEINIAELNVNTPAAALNDLLAPLLAGQDGGLVSEAGVPAVADPGADLVRLAHQHKIPVRPLVGPSSLLLAVMASGLNGQSFAFNGYLPTDAASATSASRSWNSARARKSRPSCSSRRRTATRPCWKPWWPPARRVR
jgi:16S rRNA (cytidine1402-2'-O)-methyltransferase